MGAPIPAAHLRIADGRHLVVLDPDAAEILGLDRDVIDLGPRGIAALFVIDELQRRLDESHSAAIAGDAQTYAASR